jgi:hypothetical protein
MALQVIGTALLQCSYGAAPSPYLTIPIHMEITCIMPASTIIDTMPFLNILPFAICSSKANPMVIAIMAATLGAVQVAPCIPMTFIPWSPPMSNILIGGIPAVDSQAKPKCLWAGSISVLFPGQVQVTLKK